MKAFQVLSSRKQGKGDDDNDNDEKSTLHDESNHPTTLHLTQLINLLKKSTKNIMINPYLIISSNVHPKSIPNDTLF